MVGERPKTVVVTSPAWAFLTKNASPGASAWLAWAVAHPRADFSPPDHAWLPAFQNSTMEPFGRSWAIFKTPNLKTPSSEEGLTNGTEAICSFPAGTVQVANPAEFSAGTPSPATAKKRHAPIGAVAEFPLTDMPSTGTQSGWSRLAVPRSVVPGPSNVRTRQSAITPQPVIRVAVCAGALPAIPAAAAAIIVHFARCFIGAPFARGL